MVRAFGPRPFELASMELAPAQLSPVQLALVELAPQALAPPELGPVELPGQIDGVLGGSRCLVMPRGLRAAGRVPNAIPTVATANQGRRAHANGAANRSQSTNRRMIFKSWMGLYGLVT